MICSSFSSSKRKYPCVNKRLDTPVCAPEKAGGSIENGLECRLDQHCARSREMFVVEVQGSLAARDGAASAGAQDVLGPQNAQSVSGLGAREYQVGTALLGIIGGLADSEI